MAPIIKQAENPTHVILDNNARSPWAVGMLWRDSSIWFWGTLKAYHRLEKEAILLDDVVWVSLSPRLGISLAKVHRWSTKPGESASCSLSLLNVHLVN